MDNSSPSPEHKLFTEFCRDPKDPTVEIIQGAHRFISLAIKNGTSVPKKSTLSELLREFMTVSVRPYVFQQIPRKILLELALCILQDIASRGVSRAKTLRLELIKTTAGGKKIAIVEESNEAAASAVITHPQAENATFRFSDETGKTPDVAFSLGKSHRAPYQAPDERGYFSPSKRSKRSLLDQFNEKSDKVHSTSLKN